MAEDRTGSPIAVVIGASGGLGAALAEIAEESGRFRQVVRLSRGSQPRIDIEDEKTIRDAASYVASLGVPTLFIDATGFLHDDRHQSFGISRTVDVASPSSGLAPNQVS